MIKALFTQIELNLKESINQANESISVAVAWFTNKQLFNLLLEKVNQGLNIELILRDDYINNSVSALQWINFINKGGKLYFSDASQMMHHKYCIIDGRIVISGSYNWTYQAEKVNQENVVIAHEENLANSFIDNFNALKEKSQKASTASSLNHRIDFNASKAEVEFAEVEQQFAGNIGNIEHLLIDADNHYANKRYEEAIVILQSVISIEKSEPLAYEIFAKVKFRQEDYNESLRLAEYGLTLDDSNPELHNITGLAHRSLRNLGKAVEYFDAAINLNPNVPDYYSNKIAALYSLGKDSLIDKVRYTLMKVSSNIIKNKSEQKPINILKAYICMGLVKDSRSEREKYGLKAKAVFDILPTDEKDLHDLEDINVLLTS